MSTYVKKGMRGFLYLGVGVLSFIGFALGFSEKGTSGRVVSHANDIFAEEAEASHAIETTTSSPTVRQTSTQNHGDDDDDGVSGTSLLKTPDSTR